MSQCVTKCTVCGESGHSLIHCLNLCALCNGDSRKCGCQEPPTKKKKGHKEESRQASAKCHQQQPQLSIHRPLRLSRAQNNGWSTDHVRSRWQFVWTKFRFAGHFDRSHAWLKWQQWCTNLLRIFLDGSKLSFDFSWENFIAKFTKKTHIYKL